jgi:hypothetical protein
MRHRDGSTAGHGRLLAWAGDWQTARRRAAFWHVVEVGVEAGAAAGGGEGRWRQERRHVGLLHTSH